MTSKLMKFFTVIVMLAVTLPASALKDVKTNLNDVATASAAGTVYYNEPASVVWPFNDVATYSAATITPEVGFSLTSVDLGGATFKGTEAAKDLDCAADGVVFLKVNPVNGASDVVGWSVKPAKGLTFTPTHVSAYICRFGTDSENGVTVSARKANGDIIKLGTYTARRNAKPVTEDKLGSKGVDRFDITLTPEQQKALASGDGFTLMASIGVAVGKQGGFSNVKIDGLLSGTIVDVAKYTVEAKAEPAEAAVVTVAPISESYEEGSVVKISAEKNFGYEFVNWTDAVGSVVSTEPAFNHEVLANAVLTANFKKLNTYELVYGVDGGANDYMVQAVPAPTVVDGRNMYEEGTTVTLTAISNPIVTFTNWSDGQSSSEISVRMDADKSFVANYSAIDYVAGWDFYRPGNDGRVADFYSADNDAAALVMRTVSGETSGWLDKSQLGAGGYEGRPGAVNWSKTGLGEYYWQTTVNAEAFTGLKLVTAMLYNYNAYTKYNVEYSLDGTQWKNVGVINMTGRKQWVDAVINLPAETNNAKTLSIRWIADKTSAIDGTTSNNDGIALGASYIIGNMKLVDDGTAPVLVSFVPENGSNTASINGKVVLNFDEKVRVKDGAVATLGGNELKPEVSGSVVMFPYKNLSYATDYTFTLPANTVSDLTDNYLAKAVTINFTTKTRPEVEKALYDFIVPDDGTFQDAVAAAAKRADMTKRYRVFLRNGNYKTLPDAVNTKTNEYTENKVVIATATYKDPTTYISSPNISFIGESRDGVVITNTLPTDKFPNGACVAEGIGKGDVIRINKEGANSYWQHLTVKSAMGDGKGRDIEVNDGSDKTIMKDVCLWGYQDTYVSNNEKARFYFEGGLLRGRTDYLCGKGDVYYNAVTLQMTGTGGYLAVPSVPKKYGYIFKDCEIVGETGAQDGNFTLGRPWGSGTPIALFIDTKMTVKPSAIGWAEMSNGWPARFAEYNSTTAAGTVIDLSQRKKTFGGSHPNNPVLTKAEADAVSYDVVMGGDDDWDPASLAEQAPAPANVVLDGTSLTWDNSNYALLWAIVKNGKVVDFVTTPSYTVDDPAATYAVRAANEMGGLGEAVVAADKSGISEVVTDNDVVYTRWYNAEGMEVSADYQGVVIRVETLANGETRATKLVNK